MENDNEILAEAGTPDDSGQEDASTAPAEAPQQAAPAEPAQPENTSELIRNLMNVQAQLFFNQLARMPASREKSLAVTSFQVTMFWVNEHFAEQSDREDMQAKANAFAANAAKATVPGT